MNKNLIIVLVLAVLVVVSAVQTVQLASLKSNIGSGGVSLGSSNVPQTNSVKGSSSSSGGSSLDDLPSMVGGC